MKNRKIAIAIGAVLLVFSYLVYGGVKEAKVYYLTVTELKERMPSVYREKVRVSGKVVPGSIKKEEDGGLRFRISDGNETIEVRYKGVVPDIFRDGVEAIVEGKYSPENVFFANVLLAKCPTKYESADELPKNKKENT